MVTTPNTPRKFAPNINTSLYHLIPLIISGSENRRADTAVMAITIIMIGDTIPALTAASPRIRAPTMERALVVEVGSLRSHSLNISNEANIIIASIKAGNGTVDLCAAKLIKSWVGNIS